MIEFFRRPFYANVLLHYFLFSKHRGKRILRNDNLLFPFFSLLLRKFSIFVNMSFLATFSGPDFVGRDKVWILIKRLSPERTTKDTNGVENKAWSDLDQGCRFRLPWLLFSPVGFQCIGRLLFQDLVISYPDLPKTKPKGEKIIIFWNRISLLWL